jgi:hypothetical protein
MIAGGVAGALGGILGVGNGVFRSIAGGIISEGVGQRFANWATGEDDSSSGVTPNALAGGFAGFVASQYGKPGAYQVARAGSKLAFNVGLSFWTDSVATCVDHMSNPPK